MPNPLRFALVLALLALPLLEIAVLIKAGSIFGVFPVFLVVLATAFAGFSIMRKNGFDLLGRVFAEARSGGSGLEPMLDGFLIGFAGLLLILPGLLTDILGATLLIPFVRKTIVSAGLSRFLAGATETSVNRRQDPPRHRNEPSVIEAEYKRLDD